MKRSKCKMEANAPRKSIRPIRNRTNSRRSFNVGHRPAKRLFTPEIKRYLKEWLVRRRDNPYPSRDEKKMLALETGLTYIQICNWFANWRRKLKNAGNEHPRKTWGHLIKTYNDQAQGNVEQFSICSEDSIWGETEQTSPGSILMSDMSADEDRRYTNVDGDHDCDDAWCQESYESNKHADSFPMQQFNQVSSTTSEARYRASPNNKYKNHMMKKYLRGLESRGSPIPDPHDIDREKEARASAPLMLSKWLESAAKFQPRESNYVNWNANNGTGVTNGKIKRSRVPPQHDTNQGLTDENIEAFTEGHGREEVEAAVALTRLANLFAMRS